MNMIRINKLTASIVTTMQQRYIARPIVTDKVKIKTYYSSPIYNSYLSVSLLQHTSLTNKNRNYYYHDIRNNNIISDNKNLFSSLANAEEEILDDDDSNDEEERSSNPIQKSNNNRLHQLREQLAIDQHINISDYKMNNNMKIKQNSKIKSVNPNKYDADENYELPTNVQKIVTKLRALKQVNETDSSSMLTDSYNRMHNYLRISLIERCNLRCQYCMPEEGTTLQPTNKLLSTNELKKLISLFIESGVNKVRLTGGEPLLRNDISDIISYINAYDTIHSIGITTNGITLSKQLPTLIESGLTHVNISLDTLSSDKFVTITRRKGYHKVMQSIQDSMHLLQPNNERRVKVNCVVMKDVNDDEIIDFCNLFNDINKPLDIRFIEWMPFYNNKWNSNRLVTYKQMINKIEQYYDGAPLIRLSDSPNDTTKWYALPTTELNNKNPLRRIGFITSMSNHFCSTCNRLRITADGQLKVCLFGDEEINLRSILRNGSINDDDLRLIIEASVKSKFYTTQCNISFLRLWCER